MLLAVPIWQQCRRQRVNDIVTSYCCYYYAHDASATCRGDVVKTSLMRTQLQSTQLSAIMGLRVGVPQ